MKNASTTNIIGCMFDGKIQPSDAISMLSTRLLDGKDRVIYTAARTLSNSNTPVDAKSVINCIKKEIWATARFIEDYTNYINCLIRYSKV